MALICRLNEAKVAEQGFKRCWEQTQWKTTNSCLCKTAGLATEDSKYTLPLSHTELNCTAQGVALRIKTKKNVYFARNTKAGEFLALIGQNI